MIQAKKYSGIHRIAGRYNLITYREPRGGHNVCTAFVSRQNKHLPSKGAEYATNGFAKYIRRTS